MSSTGSVPQVARVRKAGLDSSHCHGWLLTLHIAGTQSYNPMRYITSFIALLLFFLATVANAQDESEIKQYAIIDGILKKAFGPNCESGAILDVDNPPKPLEGSSEAIYEDASHQLQHCILVMYRNQDSTEDAGAMAIIREGKILWHSRAFILGFAPTASSIIGYCDLNEDGNTDIICAVASGSHFEMESLWIITPNLEGGQLLNSTYSNGYSSVVGASESFAFVKTKGSKLREIRSLDNASDNQRSIVYRWNGAAFSILNAKHR
jgi:hypothetical protein